MKLPGNHNYTGTPSAGTQFWVVFFLFIGHDCKPKLVFSKVSTNPCLCSNTAIIVPLLITQATQQLAHGGGLYAGEGVGGGDIIGSDVELDKVEDGRIRLQHPKRKHLGSGQHTT